MSDVRSALDAALEGGPGAASQEGRRAAEAARARTRRPAARPGFLRRGGAARELGAGGTRRRRRRHRDGHDRRPAGRADGQRPGGQGRVLGPEDRREDPPDPGAGARHQVPIVYLVDSAGARITDQVRMFPGRRGAGRIFHTQVRLSGQVPQVCLLFGPSAAGGAYIPAFCDVVIMRDGNASMYLGSPRMAEMVIGEEVTPRGDGRRPDAHLGLRLRPLPGESDEEAIDLARRYLSYMPSNWREAPPRRRPPTRPGARRSPRSSRRTRRTRSTSRS